MRSSQAPASSLKAPGHTAAVSAERRRDRTLVPRWLLVAALVVLGGANFLWQLGRSSYYVDEILSITVAGRHAGEIWHAASRIEVTPPAYFYFLHGWLSATGSVLASTSRIPSAVCGMALVGAVYWLASLLSPDPRRWGAVGAAALAALSPFVLQYAQLAQGYVFEMLAVTLALACCVQAEAATHRRALWLTGGTVAAVAALWLHYTSGLAILPLCIWVGTRGRLSVRSRAAFIFACLVAEGALIPLLIAQHHAFAGRPGVAGAAALTPRTAEDVLETPFAGRVDPLAIVGLIVTLSSLGTLLWARRRVVREPWLVIAIAAGTPVALVILSAVGGRAFLGHLMLPRYAAAAGPLMIVVIASAAASVRPRGVGILLAAGAILVAVVGLVDSHRQDGMYLDARAVARYVDAREQPGDLVFAPATSADGIPLSYYGLRISYFTPARFSDILAQRRRRLWLVVHLANGISVSGLRRRSDHLPGYQLVLARVFPGVETVGAVLERPRS